MIKTHEQIKEELCGLLDNYRQNIESAFKKSGFELTISAKVVLEQKGGVIEISPSIEFYPEPKTKSAKYTVQVNEHQLGLFDAKKSA